jgi:hypothetical protein
MFYHREFGYSLHDGDNTSWTFRSAFVALGFNPTDEQLDWYRGYFIQHGFGKFDGKVDPAFRISSHGEIVARASIARRAPWYSVRHLRSYDWSFISGIAAIIAAILSLLALFKA